MGMDAHLRNKVLVFMQMILCSLEEGEKNVFLEHCDSNTVWRGGGNCSGALMNCFK